MRAACGVAADQRAAMGIGQGVKPVREGGQPGLVQARQGQPQHAANRPGAHGGQVRQVHGQGLVAQGARIHVGKEMPAFQQQVRAGGDLFAGRHGKQSAIVAHAQQARRCGPGEIARDQIEFGRHGNSEKPVGKPAVKQAEGVRRRPRLAHRLGYAQGGMRLTPSESGKRGRRCRQTIWQAQRLH
ncbi:hypothetical protein G6F31_017450 [Rhizopus arrhizus]|nr:hypothetical protein G6F31_017450 [Rhizopus arrhizus]